MKLALSFLFRFSPAEELFGYTLMRENVPYFCYDDFLMHTSEQRSQENCLEFCANVYDPGFFATSLFVILFCSYFVFRGRVQAGWAF